MRLTAFAPDAPFEAVDLPTRAPGPGHVRVRTRAVSVNVVDTKIRDGAAAIAPDTHVLGCDLAGEVEALGPGVTRFGVGDAVYGCAGGVKGRDGTYAERVIADARLLARKPARLEFREAAALPLVAITAWEALVDRARVAPGERVLVHGGAGGVGHVGVQLARALGGIVHATVSSPEKAAIATRLGADATINYRETSVADYVAAQTGGTGYEVVFDTIGGANIAPSLEAAAVDGRVATIVSRDSQPALDPMHAKNLTLHVVFMLIPMLMDRQLERHGAILERLAALVDAGQITPLLDETRFTLAEIADAHARLTSGQAVGKVVVDVV